MLIVYLFIKRFTVTSLTAEQFKISAIIVDNGWDNEYPSRRYRQCRQGYKNVCPIHICPHQEYVSTLSKGSVGATLVFNLSTVSCGDHIQQVWKSQNGHITKENR